jgi:hypothetical protein
MITKSAAGTHRVHIRIKRARLFCNLRDLKGASFELREATRILVGATPRVGESADGGGSSTEKCTQTGSADDQSSPHWPPALLAARPAGAGRCFAAPEPEPVDSDASGRSRVLPVPYPATKRRTRSTSRIPSAEQMS